MARETFQERRRNRTIKRKASPLHDTRRPPSTPGHIKALPREFRGNVALVAHNCPGDGLNGGDVTVSDWVYAPWQGCPVRRHNEDRPA